MSSIKTGSTNHKEVEHVTAANLSDRYGAGLSGLGALHGDLRVAEAEDDGSCRGPPRHRHVSQFPFLRPGHSSARVCRTEPAGWLRGTGGLLGPFHRLARYPCAADCPRAHPLLDAVLGVQARMPR